MKSNFRKKKILACLLAAGCLFCLSPVDISIWQVSERTIAPVVWQQTTGKESRPDDQQIPFTLQNGRLEISSSAGDWQSPAGWNVQQAELTDLNHDQQPEVTLLVRRPFEPWPVDRLLPHGGRIQNHQDLSGQSSHIILIGWKKDHWGEVWAGSALARPVLTFQAADTNGNGHQELVVIEGNYDDNNSGNGSSLAIWKWNGFGFDLISRIERTVQQFHLCENYKKQTLIILQ